MEFGDPEILAPGVYHGARGVKRLPMFNHEYMVVVPEDAKKLEPRLRRKMRRVRGKTKGLVFGGYNRGKKLRSRISDSTDVKATRKGAELKLVSATGANAAAGKAADWHDATPAEMTIPSTIGEEKATNPFMRAASAEELGRIREAKDNF